MDKENRGADEGWYRSPRLDKLVFDFYNSKDWSFLFFSGGALPVWELPSGTVGYIIILGSSHTDFVECDRMGHVCDTVDVRFVSKVENSFRKVLSNWRIWFVLVSFKISTSKVNVYDIYIGTSYDDLFLKTSLLSFIEYSRLSKKIKTKKTHVLK